MPAAYALAIASAVLYGAADFVGGLTAKRAPTLAVVFVSQAAGAIALVVLLPLLPSATVTRGDLAWGAVAGVAGGSGVAFLYRALAIGTMSVVAPTTAVLAVAIPVVVAIALGERPSPMALAGIVLAVVAIVLVSQAAPLPAAAAQRPVPSHATLALLLAVASGVAIGIFFLALAKTSRDAGLWPLLAARGASAILFAAMAVLAGHGALRMPAAALPMAIACGLIDMLANALYLWAARRGALSVVVTLASLYPASTVMLARAVLHERLARVQVAGVGCAFVAIVLILRG